MEYKNRNILFYGPAKTPDKRQLSINDYDFIFITNNMVSLFFNLYSIEPTTKIILLANNLFTKTNYHVIQKFSNLLYRVIVINPKSVELLENFIPHDKIILSSFYISHFIPLGLSRVLNYLQGTNFKKLYITGVTFYKEGNIKDCYMSNYMIKEGYQYNIFNEDQGKHNITNEIQYTKKMCRINRNIEPCPTLREILSL